MEPVSMLVFAAIVLPVVMLQTRKRNFRITQTKIEELASELANLKGLVESQNLKVSTLTRQHVHSALEQYESAIGFLADNKVRSASRAAVAGHLQLDFAKKLLQTDTTEHLLGEGDLMELGSRLPAIAAGPAPFDKAKLESAEHTSLPAAVPNKLTIDPSVMNVEITQNGKVVYSSRKLTFHDPKRTDEHNVLDDYVKRGLKINAVKHLKEHDGLNHTDADEMYEVLYTSAHEELSVRDHRVLEACVNRGLKLYAIKYLHERRGIDLAAADMIFKSMLKDKKAGS